MLCIHANIFVDTLVLCSAYVIGTVVLSFVPSTLCDLMYDTKIQYFTCLLCNMWSGLLNSYSGSYWGDKKFYTAETDAIYQLCFLALISGMYVM